MLRHRLTYRRRGRARAPPLTIPKASPDGGLSIGRDMRHISRVSDPLGKHRQAMPSAPFKMSFQLYTTRNFPPQEAVLETLAKIGYQSVEPWLPDYGDDPKAFRKR